MPSDSEALQRVRQLLLENHLGGASQDELEETARFIVDRMVDTALLFELAGTWDLTPPFGGASSR